MLPDPLHPAVVHLPIALAVLVPLLATIWIFLISRGFLAASQWGAIATLQVLLVGSAWAALETGEAEEERVERVVAERHIETHEEAAERFLLFSGLAALPIGAGLLAGRTGRIGRVVGTIAAFGVLAAGVQVGHSGGELVYRHGAANAYATAEPRDR